MKTISDEYPDPFLAGVARLEDARAGGCVDRRRVRRIDGQTIHAVDGPGAPARARVGALENSRAAGVQNRGNEWIDGETADDDAREKVGPASTAVRARGNAELRPGVQSAAG